MLRFHQVSKYFGAQLLFSRINWRVDPGQRIGLVGVNGSGKSTLLRLCSAELEPDEGYVERHPRLQVQYLPQMIKSDSLVSGGQKQFNSLRDLLMSRADLYLLDEPTNNLDEQRIEWLEDELRRIHASLIIVSHDRAFLDATVERIVEVDSCNQSVIEYGGNYSAYMQTKQFDFERTQRLYSEQQRRMRKLKSAVDELKQKALATENSTVDDFYRGVSKRVAAAAKAREKRLHRMADSQHHIDKPPVQRVVRMPVPECARHKRLLIEMRGVVAGYQSVVLRNLNLTVESGQRIAVVGSNGAGKSLLLRTLAAELEPLSGQITRATNVQIGYLAQDRNLPAHKRLIDWFSNEIEASRATPGSASKNAGQIRTYLHRFLFSGDDVFKRIGQLSGGEVTRLQLAVFIASGVELMVLDEPTNHLDPPSIESLETALSQFDGALVIVSHDRAFRKRLNPQLTWTVQEGSVGCSSYGF
ncbi:MAG TPA: ABC-F family ATP-binding cassette domain-containing protein [Candidatus Obscuribacterales bacterium]